MDSVSARKVPETKQRKICDRIRRDLIQGKQNKKCFGGRRAVVLVPREAREDGDDEPSVPPRLLSRRARLSLRLSSSLDDR